MAWAQHWKPALWALMNDLEATGEIDETLVVVAAEFGRSPKITLKNAGREHWPDCYCVLFAGAGIQPGTVYGKSDKHGATVESHPVRPEELAATLYHALDIPLNEPQNNTGISRPITTGKPILELFG